MSTNKSPNELYDQQMNRSPHSLMLQGLSSDSDQGKMRSLKICLSTNPDTSSDFEPNVEITLTYGKTTLELQVPAREFISKMEGFLSEVHESIWSTAIAFGWKLESEKYKS